MKHGTLPDDFVQLLAILHREGTYGYWWINPGKHTIWWQAHSKQKLPQGDVNIYYGVHPTTQRKDAGQRAKLGDIAAINCLYGDYDAKDFGNDKAAALDHIEVGLSEIGVPRPSVCIDTGGGYQGYWLFDNPFILDSDDSRKKADSIQKRWVALTAGDESVKDLARVLRVPGSHNQKYDDTPLVSFVWCNLDIRYTLDDLTALLPLEPPKEVYTSQKQRPPISTDHVRRWCDEVIERACKGELSAPDGKGSNTRVQMGKLAGGVLHTGVYTEDQIVDMLLPDALRRSTDDAKETERNLRNGLEYGKKEPLPIPQFPTDHALVIVDSIAHCPSCNTPVLRSQYEYPGTSDRGWFCPRCRFPMIWPDEAWKPPDPTIYETETDTEATYVVRNWIDEGITLAELQNKHFEPERWIVENVLPEGACLLAAKYKSKKSWLALALGCAVARGGRALGRLAVSQGTVLYLDLEGKQQRIKKRTRAMLGVTQTRWPDNFHVFTSWPQGDEGLERLVKWFTIHPDTAMIIIDVLADLRRPPDRYELPYVYDRVTVKPLNQLGEYYHAAIVLVHHFNKAKNDDIMDSISGTTGLPSAVNTMWGLARDVNDSNITVLNMRGRDLENDEPLALKWDSYLCQHVIEGPASEVATSAERRSILAVLADDGTYTPKEIAEQVGKPVNAVKLLLRPLLNDGLIDKVGYGKYARVPHSTHGIHSLHSTHSTHSSIDQVSTVVNGPECESVPSVLGDTLFEGRPNALNPKSVRSVWDGIGGDTSDQGSVNGSEQSTTAINDTLQLRNAQSIIARNGSVDTAASDQASISVVNGPLSDAQRAELVSRQHEQKRRAAEQQADSDGWKAVEGNE